MQQTEREAAHGRDRDNGERGKSQTPILQLSCLTCKSKYIYIRSYMCYIQLHYINTIYVNTSMYIYI